MTALINYISMQFDRTAHSTRRLSWLMVALIAISAAGVALVVQRAPQAIDYPQRYITATPAAMCPGETFTYPVAIKIDKGDAVSRVTEGWCRVSDGICLKALQNEPYYLNFVDSYSVSTTATRTVPVDMPPGDWQLRHCNETHLDGTINVVCYAVNVEVLNCEAKP